MLSSRERVNLALSHREPDRIPLDLGGFSASGMHVDSVYLLRQALGLDEPGTPVKIIEPYQMLGEIRPDLTDALGVDVVSLWGSRTLFGFKNAGWKPWTTFGGTPVLVPEDFNTEPEPNGDILMYPEGDGSVPASGWMPKDGFYFDTMVRQPPIDDSKLNVEDNLEEFGPISDAELEHFRCEAERLYTETDKAILATFGGTSFGRVATIPGPMLKYPKGIRDVAEWYMSHTTRRKYIYKLFERQCEIGLANLGKVYQVVGNRVTAIVVTTTDFGAQTALLFSREVYLDLYKPFHKIVNDWIHRHTTWKTFIHTDGAIRPLIEDFIEAGFDILNPLQCSAAGMVPSELKKEFGDRLTFWGGGVETQSTLPFGTPVEVRQEVCERIKALAPKGGYVFNQVHNVQAHTPVENLLAMYKTLREHWCYPIS